MDSRNTTHVRLDLVHLTRAQLSDCQSVHDASVIEIIQQSKLSRCRCYDYLSTDFVSDSVVFAELNQTAVSLATQPCLKTSGFVIDTGMNNSAVPASLMRGPVFSFSRTVMRADPFFCKIAQATESPTMPPPITMQSNRSMMSGHFIFSRLRRCLSS